MKKAFLEYHIRDKEYYKKLIEDSLIILDTNSILNVYRYNTISRKKYIEILNSVKDRIWMPHQVAYEFYENRESLINTKSEFKSNLLEYFDSNISDIINCIDTANDNGKYSKTISILKYEEDLKKKLIDVLSSAKPEINNVIEQFESDITSKMIFGEDAILDTIVELYADKISEKMSDDKLKILFDEGEKRYSESIPPGYKDAKKNDNKFGDYIIWNEMIELAQKYNKPILFISDDRKEDWCHKFHGKDLGSRRELIREFVSKTGQLFYSITTSQFIEEISKTYSINSIEDLTKETKLIEEELKQNIIRINFDGITEPNDFDSYETYEDFENGSPFKDYENIGYEDMTLALKIDGQVIYGQTVKEFYKRIIIYLVNIVGENYIKQLLPYRTGSKRYLIALEGYHPSGNEFYKPLRIKDFWVETHKSKATALIDIYKFITKLDKIEVEFIK